VVIIVFVFKPTYATAVTMMLAVDVQWQHGNAGDHPPAPPHENVIRYTTRIFGIIRARRTLFLIILNPPLGPSPAICHSKVFLMVHHFSYGSS